MLNRNFDPYRVTLSLTVLALTLGVLAACGAGEEPQDEVAVAEQEAMEPADAGDGAPRVFFANVSDGDEVTSPVSLEFGTENFEIVAAQDPIVIEAGKGHHHLGVNTDCLPVGVVIEKAEPWIHFGDGSNTIDMQLPLGPARLTLQVGDGEHRTLDEDGLCATIDVMVVEGEAAD
jgi:hypothetical protein